MDDRICPQHTYAEHIWFTCVNHPEKRWHTKNIAPLGCRTIFYEGPGPECSCPVSALRHTCNKEDCDA